MKLYPYPEQLVDTKYSNVGYKIVIVDYQGLSFLGLARLFIGAGTPTVNGIDCDKIRSAKAFVADVGIIPDIFYNDPMWDLVVKGTVYWSKELVGRPPIYHDKSTLYVPNHMVYADGFESSVEEDCGPGINYFLTPERAIKWCTHLYAAYPNGAETDTWFYEDSTLVKNDTVFGSLVYAPFNDIAKERWESK